MGRAIGCAVLGVTMALAACGSSSKTVPGEDRVCEAGARRCSGLNVKVCNDDGSLESIELTCLPSQTCSDGVCTETSCVPNTRFCKGSEIYKCDSTGGGSQLTETCAVGKFCVEDDGDADCSDTACTAGEAMCDGAVATTCAADGSGPKEGGTDCAAKMQSCVDGACRALACAPGMKLCQNDDVYLCSTDGTRLDLLAECGEGEACDGEKIACRPKLCEPGKVDCDGTRVVECNEYGTAWKPGATDCAGENKICVTGSCKQQTCTPSATFCQDGDVYQCDSWGVGSNVYLTCNPDYQHCEAYSSTNAWCTHNQCQPGEKECDGNTVKVCTAEGTFPPSGTDCSDTEFCEAGACKPRGCSAVYEYYCKDGDIYYCDYHGGTAQQACPSETSCKKIENGVTCVAFPCTAGSKACVGNKVGTCAQDGSGLSQVTKDCTTGGEICNASGECAATAEDLVGVAESAEVDYAGEFMGNVFEVTAARKLTEIEMNFVLASPRELRWVIYEHTGQQFIARVDKVVSNQSGTGFVSSGPLSYNLKPGKRYLLGVAVSGGESIAYYDTAPWSPQVSFGTTLGYLHTSYSPQIYADYSIYAERLYQMRVTTSAQ